MVDFANRLQLSPHAGVTLDDLLKDVPRDAAPLVRQLWERRADLEKWVAAEPDRAQRLIAEPELVVKELFPEFELPTTIPGSELKKAILERVPVHQIQPQLELPDPKVVDAMALFRRLLDRVAAGAVTRAQIATSPEAEVQAAALSGTSPDAVSRVASAIRFVLGLPPAVAILDQSIVLMVGEALSKPRRPPRPPR